MEGNKEIKSSAHSKYRCQYHIVFAPKYRRQEIYGKIKKCVRNTAKIMHTKGSRNNRSRSMPRPYTHAGKYPTAHKYSTVYGISQGQKQFNDFRPTCKFEI